MIMTVQEPLLLLLSIWIIASCNAFSRPARQLRVAPKIKKLEEAAAASDRDIIFNDDNAKTNFLNALDQPYDLNELCETRTKLLNELIDRGAGLLNPGSDETFMSVAPGIWRVVYAPHMSTIADIFRGELSVQYNLELDGTMTSHARFSIPFLHLFGYLSVSGVYGSVNNDVCRVDFDEAWLRLFEDQVSSDEGPYNNIAEVPNSIWKSLIRNIGRASY